MRAELLHERIKRTVAHPERTRQGNQARSDTRIKLLAAALELFAQKGFEATTMRDLAKAVGIKAPGIYSHFDSKQQVLREAMTWMMDDFLNDVLTADDPDQDPDERLRLILRRHVLHAFENPTLARAYDLISSAILLERIGDAKAQAALRDRHGRYESTILGLIERLLSEPGKSRVDAASAARAIITMHDQMARWYVPKNELAKEAIIETHWKFTRGILQYHVAVPTTAAAPGSVRVKSAAPQHAAR